LTGSFGVGKSSLFKRFIEGTFDEKYNTTVGVKVNNKSLQVGDTTVNLLLWDISGEVRQRKVPVSYFLGASAVIFVFDLSRPFTAEQAHEDIVYLKNLLPNAIVKFVGNKKDLVTEADLAKIAETQQDQIDFFTSAKTGETVEALFLSIAKGII
jgi:small GTP-binding protein